MSSIDECKIVMFPEIKDDRGSLSFVENVEHIAFDIKRIFYIYDIKVGMNRGAHAHKVCQQFMIAISGSFDVTVDDGKKKKKFHLDKRNCGLYMCSMIWCDLDNFSTDAICLTLASDIYDESDYIRCYREFIALSDRKNENSVS